MREQFAALLTACLVLAGCSDAPERDGGAPDGNDGNGGGGDGGDGGGAPSCTPGKDGCPCPKESRAQEGTCIPIDSILFDVQLTGSGAYEVAVPYPHGDWCLTGDDWLAGMQETHNLTHHETRDVERGKVLFLQARDKAQFVGRIDLGNKTTCQTLRYDPWSIDPDPAQDTIELQASKPIEVTIYLRTVVGGCADLRQFKGQVTMAGDWVTVPQQFNGTSCS